jgi:hypothetical protein
MTVFEAVFGRQVGDFIDRKPFVSNALRAADFLGNFWVNRWAKREGKREG